MQVLLFFFVTKGDDFSDNNLLAVFFNSIKRIWLSVLDGYYVFQHGFLYEQHRKKGSLILRIRVGLQQMVVPIIFWIFSGLSIKLVKKNGFNSFLFDKESKILSSSYFVLMRFSKQVLSRIIFWDHIFLSTSHLFAVALRFLPWPSVHLLTYPA